MILEHSGESSHIGESVGQASVEDGVQVLK